MAGLCELAAGLLKLAPSGEVVATVSGTAAFVCATLSPMPSKETASIRAVAKKHFIWMIVRPEL
jgi:hypothetical protein